MPHEFKNVNGYVAPALAIDAALLKGREILLIRRGQDPDKGKWALPGGFMEVGERAEDAGRRELLEETGLKGDVVDVLGVWSDPKRDPRGHVVSFAFVMKVAGIVDVAVAGDDAAEARWFPLDAPPDMAFDHADMIRAAREWIDRPGNFEKLGDTDLGKCA